jgi:spore cortex formation protein SpoVR/YcgB (stage V sporulation)
MNATNNKKTTSILITAIATAAIMVIGPVAGVNPVFALGHFHEGDNGSSSQEFDKFEDCLSDLEHETDDITEEQIEDCIDSAYNGESDESSREDNDDDREDDEEKEDMQRAEEDEQEAEEDLAFFGDESEDSSSNNFNNDSDFADDENSSTG